MEYALRSKRLKKKCFLKISHLNKLKSKILSLYSLNSYSSIKTNLLQALMLKRLSTFREKILQYSLIN